MGVWANGDISATFKEKSAYMKTWKPASTPSVRLVYLRSPECVVCIGAYLTLIPLRSFTHSFTQNRDRLELYSLHKQSISGDAPGTMSVTTGPERAKYQAWRSKSGLTKQEAMGEYVQESDRQVRVYGLAGQQQQQVQQVSTPSSHLPDSQQAPPQQATMAQPRGLAAIPLLCAAASESRPAFIRRLSNTQPEHSWWSRQEALCATPGSIWALPETALIAVASLQEWVSLTADGGPLPLPAPVVQSFLWPLHNVLLALWMGMILEYTAVTAALELVQTVVWGRLRTGQALPAIWKDEIQWSSTAVHTLAEVHQPISARLVGVAMLPFTVLVGLTSFPGNVLVASVLYTIVLVSTWWYWFLVLPWLGLVLLGFSFVAGNCFALIELAGV